MTTRVEYVTVAQIRERLAVAHRTLAEAGPVDCEHPAAREVCRLEAVLARVAP